MLFWNYIAKQILDKISDSILNWSIISWFYLIAWPKDVGKKALFFSLINKISVLEQDKLILEDPWNEDSRLYQIKVDVEDKDKFIIINDKNFLNLWARQISDFISKTPIGNYKIVFIENIERLNISSANALLKIFEEPPVNVFIFATTSNKNKILSTIISRAIIINMFEITKTDFENFLGKNMLNLKEWKKDFLYAICGGRIWLAQKLLANNDFVKKLKISEKFMFIQR